jgi:hypothetical protein
VRYGIGDLSFRSEQRRLGGPAGGVGRAGAEAYARRADADRTELAREA